MVCRVEDDVAGVGGGAEVGAGGGEGGADDEFGVGKCLEGGGGDEVGEDCAVVA